MGGDMFKLWTMAVSLAVALGLPVAQQPVPHRTTAGDLRCFWPERPPTNGGCGCGLKITTLSCDVPDDGDSGRYHFYSDLQDGAPLWINPGGRQFSIRSLRPPTDSFLHGEGDSWRETYQDAAIKVQIDYRPGKSTCSCAKPPDGDGCEYFDVNARVTVTLAGRRPRTYSAVGTCGC
jgi:hypothetical protein